MHVLWYIFVRKVKGKDSVFNLIKDKNRKNNNAVRVYDLKFFVAITESLKVKVIPFVFNKEGTKIRLLDTNEIYEQTNKKDEMNRYIGMGDLEQSIFTKRLDDNFVSSCSESLADFLMEYNFCETPSTGEYFLAKLYPTKFKNGDVKIRYTPAFDGYNNFYLDMAKDVEDVVRVCDVLDMCKTASKKICKHENKMYRISEKIEREKIRAKKKMEEDLKKTEKSREF